MRIASCDAITDGFWRLARAYRSKLNPGDQAVLRMLVLNNDGTLQVDGRIAGVRDLEVRSVLEGGPAARDTSLDWLMYTLIGLVIGILIAALIWNSKRVMEWRQTRLGFDPARYFYTLAQEEMLKGSPNLEAIGQAIGYLGQAFSWDRHYLERAKMDPLFTKVQEYEKFKAVIEKYEDRPESD